MNRPPISRILPALVLSLGLLSHVHAGTATITFSGLYNGITDADDPEAAQMKMPDSYQPLQHAANQTNPPDGGTLGVYLAWDGFVSSHKYNRAVRDHTEDGTGDLGGGVFFMPKTGSIGFDKPVEIPSFFWTLYGGGKGKTAQVSVFRNASDDTPLKTVTVSYDGNTGYVWQEVTDFAGLKIEKIVFTADEGTSAINLDDITVKTD